MSANIEIVLSDDIYAWGSSDLIVKYPAAELGGTLAHFDKERRKNMTTQNEKKKKTQEYIYLTKEHLQELRGILQTRKIVGGFEGVFLKIEEIDSGEEESGPYCTFSLTDDYYERIEFYD